MRKQLAICAGLLLLGPATAGTAEAQIYPGPAVSEAALPPYEIMSIVRSTGLAPLTRPMRRGPFYVLVAVDRVGRQMRVVVDAQLGDIVNLRPALAAVSAGPDLIRPNALPSAGAPTAELNPAIVPNTAHPNGDAAPAPMRPPATRPMSEVGSAPVPPHSVPSVRPPTAMGQLPATRLAVTEPGAAEPQLPPLPRPRPNLASSEASQALPTAKPPVPPAAPTPAAAAQDADKIE